MPPKIESSRFHDDEVEEVEEECDDADPGDEEVWGRDLGGGGAALRPLLHGHVKLLEDPRHEHDQAAHTEHDTDPTGTHNKEKDVQVET